MCHKDQFLPGFRKKIKPELEKNLAIDFSLNVIGLLEGIQKKNLFKIYKKPQNTYAVYTITVL